MNKTFTELTDEDEICANCGHPKQNHLDHRFKPPRLTNSCGCPIGYEKDFRFHRTGKCSCKGFKQLKSNIARLEEALK